MATNMEIYTGFWTNWADGRVAGATLTLSQRGGAYLIAFLAIFVRLTGSNTWQILSYFLFRAKVSPEDQDKTSQQLLLILRNASTDIRTLLELGRIRWNGRKNPESKRRQLLPLLLTAVLHTIAFAAAGIFASRVTTTRSDVKLQSTLCGTWPVPSVWTSTDQGLELREYYEHDNMLLSKARDIVDICYNSSTPLTEACNPYGPRFFDWNVTTTGSCPFDPSMCVNDTVVRFDSGLKSSLFDLGINSDPADAISFQKVVECTPITIDGFSAVYSAANLTQDLASFILSELYQSLEGSSYTAFFYGRSLITDLEPTFIYVNSTFDDSVASTIIPYRIDAEVALPIDFDNGTSFVPIEQLRRSDAQVMLLFLSNMATYPSPVTDPWFNAQLPYNYVSAVGPATVYAPEQTVHVLGCTDQTKICNSAGICIPLNILSLTELSDELQLNLRQTGILSRFYDNLFASINFVAQVGVDGGLLASARTNWELSAALPSDQWILEVQHWYAMLWTYIQLGVVEYVTGLSEPEYDHWLQPPGPDDEWMCTNQIIRRTDYASFSVLGLAMIIFGGLLVMILNLFLDTLWPRLRPSNAENKYRDEQWASTELLRLRKVTDDSVDDSKFASDEKTELPRSARRYSESLRPIWQALQRCSWSKSSPNMAVEERNDSLLTESTTETIELHLQQEDFPPEDLERLISAPQ